MKNKQLTSGVIYDVLHTTLKYNKPFVLDRKIKPAWSFNTHIFGQVFTCKGKLIRHSHFLDDNIRLKMLSEIPKNRVMVYDTDRYYDVAHYGDITATIAQKKGCIGAVIDGCTRDIEGIEDINFPVFCRDILPIDSYGTWQIVDYNCEIILPAIDGRVVVNPNDWIFGDRDSVIIIPESLVESVVIEAEKQIDAEERLKNKILNNNIDLIQAYEEENIH